MKKTTRLTLIALLVVLFVTSTVVLAACNKGISKKEALAGYELEVPAVVSDDFTLPAYLGSEEKPYKTTWTSDNDAITIVEREGQDTLAEVHLGKNYETTEVKLTLSLSKKLTKEFTVIVDYFDVYKFSDNFSFRQKNARVGKDFDLQSSFTYKGETAQITWSVPSEYSSLLKIENNNKCKVELDPEGDKPAQIWATFAYGTETNTLKFNVTVGEVMEHLEEVDYWYNNEGVTIEMSGYVVAIHENSPSYKNVTLYMIDDDFCAGYYLYRVGASAADKEKIEVGVHVTVTGTKNQNYNGLYEASNSGTLVVDEDVAPINPRDHIYAIDNDFISGSPAAIYNESRLVSLSGWKIVEKYKDKPASGATGTLFYVQKGDSEKIAIAVSKYLEGEYVTSAGDETWEALCAYYDSLNVGDVINVTGLLGNYKGFQIMPLKASDIVKVESESTASADALAVKQALAAVAKAVSDAKLGSVIVSDKTITMPTSVADVAISYTVCGTDRAVKVEGGNIKVVPIQYRDTRTIQVTYTKGDYTTYTFFTIVSQRLSDAEIVAEVKADLEKNLTKVIEKADDTITLPATADFDGVTITWAVKDGEPEWAVISGGKLMVTELPKKETKITLVATIKKGETATATAEIEITVSAAPNVIVTFEPLTEAKEGTYKLHMYQSNLKLDLYATGEMDGFYYGTSDDVNKAADFVIAAVDGGYTIKVGSKFAEIVPRTDGSTGINVVFNAAQTAGKVWKWNDTLKTFTMMSGNNTEAAEVEYYLGTDGTKSYKTFSANAVSSASGNIIGQFGVVTKIEVGSMSGITEPKEGEFFFGLYQLNLKSWLYATGEVNESGYLVTTEDPSEAALFTIAASGENFTIKVGDKFLGLAEDKKITLGDTAVLWAWNTEAKVFTITITGDKAGTYYLGSFNNFDTISASLITYITGEKASSVGVSNFVAVFAEEIVGYDRSTDHEHTFTQVQGQMKHTKKCEVEGCEFAEGVVEECTVVNNTCTVCKHTYTEEEILARIFDSSNTVPAGTYVLTGRIVNILSGYPKAYNGQWETECDIVVGDKTIRCHYMYGEEQDLKALKLGATITVTGTFSVYNNAPQFAQGCTHDPNNVVYKQYTLEVQETGATGGTIVDDSEVALSTRTNVQGGTDIKFKITAPAGFKVSTVTVNGKAINLGEDDYYTFTVAGNTVIVVTYISNSTPDPVWRLVKSMNQLHEGDTIVLVYDGNTAGDFESGKTFLQRVQGVVLNEDNETIKTLPADALQFKLGKDSDNWTFLNSEDKALGMTAASNGKLAWGSGTTTWTISIAEETFEATITSTMNTEGWKLQYNATSGQERFANYKSAQKLPQIFVLEQA